MNDLLLTYYGDDFTGSTDALEALALGGVRAALFLAPPSPEQLSGPFAGLQAVGVAGISRTMTPVEMDRELRPILAQLRALGAPLCHYKVCSTFDSSPEVGSIGHAIDIGAELFQPRFVPLAVGAPPLRRYVVFGNLFATVDGVTYRLDRHPTMSQHPVTPMNEADLRRHLARQTERSIDLFAVLQLGGSHEAVKARFDRLLADEPEIVLFDTLEEEHLQTIGRLIWETRGEDSLFVVGSSGVEYALVAHWEECRLVSAPEAFAELGPVEQLVVLSGSASPVTAEQMEWAFEHGFAGVRIDTVRLLDPNEEALERSRLVEEALSLLNSGRSAILYTALGPDDPSIAETRRRGAEMGLERGAVGRRLGEVQGQILKTILKESGLQRACVAGGDTSGYVASALGIIALELLRPIAPGAPLCRASAEDASLDGLEIALKGGQLGGRDYFGRITQGQGDRR